MPLFSFLTSPKYTAIPENDTTVPKPTRMPPYWKHWGLIFALIFVVALTYTTIRLSSNDGDGYQLSIKVDSAVLDPQINVDSAVLDPQTNVDSAVLDPQNYVDSAVPESHTSVDSAVLDPHTKADSSVSSHGPAGCNIAYRLTAQRWIDEGMDTYLADWIAEHPECNNAEEGWYSCYAQTVGFGGFYCLLGTGNCNSEAYCTTADTKVYYTLTSISHLTAWYNNLYGGLQYAFSQSLTALPSLTLGLGYKPGDDSFMKQQLINIVAGMLDRWTTPIALPISIIKDVISDKVKSEPVEDFSNFATISEAVRHFWRSVLNGVDISFQHILQNGTVFAAVVKDGSYLQNPSSFTSIPNIDATFLPSIIIKYADIFLSQQSFSILDGSDTPYYLGPSNCLLDKERNDTWNSWLDPTTKACWVWGIKSQYNRKDKKPFDKVAKFLFVDGNNGQPYTTAEELVRGSIECHNMKAQSGSALSVASSSDLKSQSSDVDGLPCVYDFPVCHSSSDEGCSIINGCSIPVPFWPYCLSFWDT